MNDNLSLFRALFSSSIYQTEAHLWTALFVFYLGNITYVSDLKLTINHLLTLFSSFLLIHN